MEHLPIDEQPLIVLEGLLDNLIKIFRNYQKTKKMYTRELGKRKRLLDQQHEDSHCVDTESERVEGQINVLKSSRTDEL